MAFDITGITNENEFYTHHYLSAILENDLRDLFKEWNRKADEEDIPQPYKNIRSLRKEYFALQDALQRERNIEDRLALQRDFQAQLLSALGYEPYFTLVLLDDGVSIPLIGGINKPDGSPELWILEAADVFGEEHDPLEMQLLKEQYPEDSEIQKILDIPLEEIITRRIFGHSEPPRWIILLNSTQLLLLDRTKWHEKRLLRFNIREILDRRETTTLQAMAALLHRDSICPKDGMPLLDTLDENSHKHAFAVSEDLKYSLRKAIELLGNEAVWFLREKAHEKIYGRDMAGQLTRECLRYMYRMLFLFYIEARPELEYLPDKKSKEYHKGYSLESLRELEMVQLTTDESKNGFYFHESISLLFDLLYNGFQPEQADMFGVPDHHTFRIAPLRSHLFDPKQTPLLNRVKLRNFVMQEIIELMSLSRPKKGKKNRRGRISYAQLGINQLGAVYEALLSYQGFFAETDLYEVKKAGEKHNVLETAYFVKPEDIEQYTEDERVFNDDGTLVKYEKGTFIYRLAGRDREKSASYYTPEVLTQCLVKYALKELLKDKTADEILELTVCEPAMGSAAFLNEAVNQLAKAYLDRKQKELDQTISHDAYPKELQKVKMYIADRNVHGVDLNPVAVELAEVSLWLNTIYEGGFVPWFGMQLVCGNSLIGARRQVFHENLLKKQKKTDPLWLDEVPERVMPGQNRENDTVYHFLLPDKGMADYKDKVIKQMAVDEIKTINEWRKEFTKPFSKTEIYQLKKLSDAVDKLWQRNAEMQRDIDNRTTDPLLVFGQKDPKHKWQPTTTEFKDRIFQQEMFSKNVRNSSPYRRLKLVMDYWCAFYFWPIERADLLPSRAEFLFDLTLVLDGNLFDADIDEKGQQLLFPDTRPKQMSLKMLDELGYVNVDKLCEKNQRLGLVKELAERYRYLHWELDFADLFRRKGGFDLVLGNPPWIKVAWREGGVLADAEPQFVIRKYSASKLKELREETLERMNLRKLYFSEFEEAEGTQHFLNTYQNYPLLKGVQTNLYKCFITKNWEISSFSGIVGIFHQPGCFDDPKGGHLRSAFVQRLNLLARFRNEFLLFTAIKPERLYCFTISFGQIQDNVNFKVISNLYHPVTLDKSWSHDGQGPIPLVKTAEGKWILSGHRSRIIEVDAGLLSLFSKLYDSANSSFFEARLPVIHSREILSVLKKFADVPLRLRDIQGKYFSTVCFDETYGQRDGTIKRETRFPKDPSGWVVSGPHFYVGNPLYKTPREKCRLNTDYDVIDLTQIPEEYLPRTNYIPGCSLSEYERRIPRWNGKLTSDDYRLAFRAMLAPTGERTLISCLIPPRTTHINGVYSYRMESRLDLLTFAAHVCTLPFDFFIKSTGKTNLHELPTLLPLLHTDFDKMLFSRLLRLNCLTKHYARLWNEHFDISFQEDSFAKEDHRFRSWKHLTRTWQRTCALRTPWERRQALVEMDVLSAMALGITLQELKTIYRIEFRVMRRYEHDTYYDQRGLIVFTSNSKGLNGIGLTRKQFEEIKYIVAEENLPSWAVDQNGMTYLPPFDNCDREKDYEIVWPEFERRFKEQEGNS